MLIVKPDTSGGFSPKLRVGRDIGLPAEECSRLDGRLDVSSLSSELQQKLIGIARLRNVVSSLRIEGERIELEQAREVVETGRAMRAEEVGILRLTKAYASLAKGQLPNLTIEGIEEAHSSLFEDVLEKGIVGSLKTQQNYLVDLRSGKAHFVPTPPDRTEAELKSLLRWYSEKAHFHPAPVVAAVFFAEFQGIHPFVDGNGRLGRYLNLAILRDLGMKNAPIIPLDTRFFRTLGNYYETLATTNSGREYGLWTRYYVGQLQAAYRLAASRSELKVLVERFARPSTRALLVWVLGGSGGWFSRGDLPNPKGYSESILSAALAELTKARILEAKGDRKGRRYRLGTRFLTKLYGPDRLKLEV